MALQKIVNTIKAVAVAGDVAVPEQAMYYPRNLLADENGLVCGTFAYLTATDGEASNTVNGAPVGLVQRNLSYPLYDVTVGASLVVPEGQPMQIMTQGDMWVQTTTAATVGQKVFAGANGVIATGAAGATVSGATETDWIVASAGKIGDLIIIYKH
ncbi:MAG: hypothetical protein IJ131_02285 [Eggerthellaceae bacterium]|nr:hypothetical protein [Eggerthellaceae bacterium]